MSVATGPAVTPTKRPRLHPLDAGTRDKRGVRCENTSSSFVAVHAGHEEAPQTMKGYLSEANVSKA